MPEIALASFRAAILADYIELAKFVGVDPFAILARAQIDPRSLEDPDTPIALNSVIQVLEESAAISGRDDFGILLAENRVFSSLGPVALLMEHEHSIRDILKAAVEFRPIVNGCLHVHVEDADGFASILFKVPAPYDAPQFLSHVVAVAKSVLIDASDGAWRPDCIHFRHTSPRWKTTYQRHFGCSLSFGNDFDGLSCTSAALDAPNASANAMLATYARRLLNLCPEMHESQSVSHRVRTILQLSLPHGGPRLAKTSARLGTTSRTLQRLLAAEGETFAGVLKQLRMDLARRYLLHSEQDITQISFNLGFADHAAFSRWFSGQFDMPPSTWRKSRLDHVRAKSGYRVAEA